MAIIDYAVAEEAAQHPAGEAGAAAEHGQAANEHGAAAGTLAHGGTEGASDFPPFDPANFAPQLVWLALIFGLLYVLMSRIALPRVASILSDRENKIESDLLASRELQTKAQAAAAANEETLRATRSHAQSIGREAQQQAAAEAQARRAALDSDFVAKLAAADSQIAAAKGQALAHVEDIASEAAASIIEKLTGQRGDLAAFRTEFQALKTS